MDALEAVLGELRFAPAGGRFALQVQAARLAVQAGDLSRARELAERAVELEPGKMLGWAALREVCEAAGDGLRLAGVLHSQSAVARANGNTDKAAGFAKESAEAFERLGNASEALPRWRDALQLGSDAVLALWGVNRCLEACSSASEADAVLLQLWTQAQDVDAAARYLSRPAHAILESRRDASSAAPSAQSWVEFETRIDALSQVAEIPLLTACRMLAREINFPLEQSALELQQSSPSAWVRQYRTKTKGDDDVRQQAVVCRALFHLARYALFAKRSPAVAWATTAEAEALEQIVYARNSSNNNNNHAPNEAGRKPVVVIGARPVARPFLGNEVFSLLCSRTSATHLVKGEAALCLLPGGLHAGLRDAERSARDGLLALGVNDALTHRLRMLTVLSSAVFVSVMCSRGMVVVVAGGAGDSNNVDDGDIQHLFDRPCTLEVVARVRERCDNPACSLAMHVAATYLLFVARVLAFEQNHAPPALGDATEAATATDAFWNECVQDTLLIAPSEPTSSGYGALFTLWRLRLEFDLYAQRQTRDDSFDFAGLGKLVEASSASSSGILPLALELMGKYLMGVMCFPVAQVPDEQPDRKWVRDPMRAIRSFQKAVELDPTGLGAVAPLANAFHAGNQEDQAALLYTRVGEALAARTAASRVNDAVVSSWVYTRFGLQQLHQGKNAGAMTSFQRALGAFGRADTSTNVTAWIGVAEAHNRMGRLGAAAQTFERVVDMLQPTPPGTGSELWAVCVLKLCRLHVKMGRARLALPLLEQVVSSPQPAELLHMAVLELGECLVEDAHYWRVRGALARVRANLVRARQLLASFVRDVNGVSVVAWKILGDACGDGGDDEEEEVGNTTGWTAYAMAVFLEPWESLARYDLARHLLQTKSRSEALAPAEASVVLNPNDAMAWNLLGLCRRDFPLIRQHCVVRALRLDAAWSLPWLNHGWNLCEFGCGPLAKRAFSHAQTIDADSSIAWLGHAAVMKGTSNGDYVASLECAVDAAGYGADSGASKACMSLGVALCHDLEHAPPKRRRRMAMRILHCSTVAVQLATVAKRPRKHLATAWGLCGVALFHLGSHKSAYDAFQTSATHYQAVNDAPQADAMLLNAALCDTNPARALQSVGDIMARRAVSEVDAHTWFLVGSVHAKHNQHNKDGAQCLEAFQRARDHENVASARALQYSTHALLHGDSPSETRVFEALCDALQSSSMKALELLLELAKEPRWFHVVRERVPGACLLPLMRGGGEGSGDEAEEHAANADLHEETELLAKLVHVATGNSWNAAFLFPWSMAACAAAAGSEANGKEVACVRTLTLVEFDFSEIPSVEVVVNACREVLLLNRPWSSSTSLYWLHQTELKLRHLAPWESR